MIRDELDLDGRPNLNLASFVGTYMDKEVNILFDLCWGRRSFTDWNRLSA
jgi:hypothetical protein